MKIQPVSSDQKDTTQGGHPRLNRPEACELHACRVDLSMFMLMCLIMIMLVVVFMIHHTRADGLLATALVGQEECGAEDQSESQAR